MTPQRFFEPTKGAGAFFFLPRGQKYSLYLRLLFIVRLATACLRLDSKSAFIRKWTCLTTQGGILTALSMSVNQEGKEGRVPQKSSPFLGLHSALCSIFEAFDDFSFHIKCEKIRIVFQNREQTIFSKMLDYAGWLGFRAVLNGKWVDEKAP